MKLLEIINIRDTTKKHRLLLLIPALLIVCAFSIFTPSPREDGGFSFNDWINTRLFKMRYFRFGIKNLSPDLAVVTITDESVNRQGVLSNERQIYADLLLTLADSQAETICINDYFRLAMDSETDMHLSEAVRLNGNVVTGCELKSFNTGTKATPAGSHDYSGQYIFYPVIKKPGKPFAFEKISLNFDELNAETKACGAVNLSPAGYNNAVRSVPLLFSYRDGFVFSLPLIAICHFYGINPCSVEVRFGEYIQLRYKTGRQEKKIRIPVDLHGCLTLDYLAPLQDSFDFLAAEKIIDYTPDIETEFSLSGFFEGTLVFIVNLRSNNKNFTRGIFDTVYPKTLLTGLAINTILTGSFYAAPGGGERLVTLMLVAVLYGLAVCILPSRRFPLIFPSLLLLCCFTNILLFFFAGRSVNLTEPFFLSGLYLLFILLYSGFTRSTGTASPSRRAHEIPPAPPLAVNAETRFQLYKFSQKEIDIALLLDKGLQYSEIASALDLSIGGVKKRINNLYTKCGAANRIEMINKVFR